MRRILILTSTLLILGVGCSNRQNISDKTRQIQTPTPFSGGQIETTTIKIDSLSDWVSYVDETYGFSLKHPKQIELGKENPYINQLSMSGPVPFIIDIDPPEFDEVGTIEKKVRAIKMTLAEYAKKIWQLNGEVGNLITTTLSGRPAYSFTVDSAFTSDSGVYLIDGTYQYTFTENRGKKIVIGYPVNNTSSRQVFMTFKLIK